MQGLGSGKAGRRVEVLRVSNLAACCSDALQKPAQPLVLSLRSPQLSAQILHFLQIVLSHTLLHMAALFSSASVA